MHQKCDNSLLYDQTAARFDTTFNVDMYHVVSIQDSRLHVAAKYVCLIMQKELQNPHMVINTSFRGHQTARLHVRHFSTAQNL